MSRVADRKPVIKATDMVEEMQVEAVDTAKHVSQKNSKVAKYDAFMWHNPSLLFNLACYRCPSQLKAITGPHWATCLNGA